MADNVETFTFDSTSAQADLAKLATSVNVASASVTAFNAQTVVASKVDPFELARKSAAKYQREATKALKSIDAQLSSSNQNVKEIGVSWNTIGRIIQTQVIVQALNSVKQLFFEAADAAEEFQITVARIRGIADGPLGDIEDQLKEIGIAAGRNLGEVADAALEAFQNDLGTTAETVELLRGTLTDLALVTDGTLGQAVNTVTPIIKAYNLSLEEAQGVSAQLFNLIDTGVVTIQDLEGNLGTVVPIARQLGVELEDVFAAIATGTLAGVDATKSITQLRNVLVKLTKPTEVLKEAFATLGVSTFPELLSQSDNLRDAIERIFNALGRDPERFARAFNTIRGQLGAINIQLENAGKAEFDRILGEAATAGDKLSNALKLIKDTDAFASREQAAQLNVILTELGETALTLKTNLVGAFLTVVPNADAAKSALVGAGAALSVYAATALGLVSIPFVTAFPAALIAGFAVAVGTQAVPAVLALRDAITGLQTDRDALQRSTQVLELFEKGSAEVIKEVNESVKDLEQGFPGVSQEARSAFNVIRTEALLTQQALGGVFDDALAAFQSGSTQLFKDLDSAVKNVGKAFEKTESDVANVQQKISDFNFERGLKGLTEGTRLIREQQRATNQLGKARALLSGLQAGATDITTEEVVSAFKLAEKYAEAAKSTADRQKNIQNIKKTEDLIEDALIGQRTALVDLRNIQNTTRATNLQDDVLQTNKQYASIIQNVQEYQKLIGVRTTGGQFKDAKELNDDRAKAVDLNKTILEQLRVFQDSDAFKATGLADEVDALVTAFETNLNNVTIDWSQNVDTLQSALDANGAFRAQVEFTSNLQQLAEQTGNQDLQQVVNTAASSTDNPVARQQAINKAVAEGIKQQTILGDELAVINQRIEQNQAAITAASQTSQAWDLINGSAGEEVVNFSKLLDGIAGSVAGSSEQAAIQLRSGLVGVLNEIKLQTEQGIIPEDRFNRLTAQGKLTFDALGLRLEQLKTQGEFNPQLLEDLKLLADEVRKVEDLKIEPEVDTSNVKLLNQEIGKTVTEGMKAEKEVGDIGSAAASGIEPALGLSSTVASIGDSASSATGPVRTLVSVLQTAIALQSQLDGGGSGGSANVFRGGVAYRAAGGDSRGQDTIPAMLSPEETVINGQASRNFFSQLQAINSGSTSASGISGGSTTNINVGDINVTSTNETPTGTARQVGQSIEREIRRRTFRL